MKAIFESEDPKETLRLTKSKDMALFIWELVHNGWRDFKHADYDYQKAWDKIGELLERYDINVDELVE